MGPVCEGMQLASTRPGSQTCSAGVGMAATKGPQAQVGPWVTKDGCQAWAGSPADWSEEFEAHCFPITRAGSEDLPCSLMYVPVVAVCSKQAYRQALVLFSRHKESQIFPPQELPSGPSHLLFFWVTSIQGLPSPPSVTGPSSSGPRAHTWRAGLFLWPIFPISL